MLVSNFVSVVSNKCHIRKLNIYAYPHEPLCGGDDLREAAENDIPDLLEGRVKHDLGLLHTELDDHDLGHHVAEVVKHVAVVIASLKPTQQGMQERFMYLIIRIRTKQKADVFAKQFQ